MTMPDGGKIPRPQPPRAHDPADPADPDAPEWPRFPYAVGAFTLACVVCAAWLWIACSYRRDMTLPARPPPVLAMPFLEKPEAVPFVRRPLSSYVRLRGVVVDPLVETGAPLVSFLPDVVVGMRAARDPGEGVLVVHGRHRWDYRLGDGPGETVPVIDTMAGRWVPESVSGLVVAAMGAFVFALYFRKWLAERRAFDAPAPRL